MVDRAVLVSVGSRFLTFAALVAVLYGTPAASQSSSGDITGVARAAHGAVVSGATITVTNQATGVSRRTTTAADGSYGVSGLAPGAYTVAASLLGSRRVSQNDVQVGAGLLIKSTTRSP